MFLDSEVQARRIAAVRTQVPIELKVGDTMIGRYIADFEVEYPNKLVEWHEVKGRWTPLARWKVAHCRAQYPNRRLKVIPSKNWS